jgi:large subunit ribosomal protein L23
MSEAYRVVIRPLVTEKSSALYGARKEYAFVCAPDATKPQIREAIERMFGVTVTSLRTMQQPAKRRTRGGRSIGRVARWKKAYVTLAEGQEIEGLYEGY